MERGEEMALIMSGILLYNTAHPNCFLFHQQEFNLCMFITPRTSSISINQTAFPCFESKCNLTFILAEIASEDISGIHVIKVILVMDPESPNTVASIKLVCFKGNKITLICSLCLHLSEGLASLSTLLSALALEMKYWPPESHLAPNWAILLLFSPSRPGLELHVSDGCEGVSETLLDVSTCVFK